ncbi:MAG: STAS domain-containing protein [Actinomycetota bacterium]|nr:STAS domain-containing protein [Actinomycetota bacterium]
MTDDSDFSLAFSRARGKVVVDIHGPLDAGNARELKDRLVDVIDGQGNRQLVLDLARTTRIDSAGLSVLVDALKRMQKTGGRIVLSGPTCQVARALAVAGLDKVFTITPSWTHPARGGRTHLGRPAGWN